MLKFRKNELVWFFKNMGKHIEAASVRHADINGFHTRFDRFHDHLFHQRNERIKPFNGKTLLPDKCPVNKFFKSFHI